MRTLRITPSPDLVQTLEHIAALELRKHSDADPRFIMGHAVVSVELVIDRLDTDLDFGKHEQKPVER